MVPPLRLLESGTFRPGALRPLRGISCRGGGRARWASFLIASPLLSFGLYFVRMMYARSAPIHHPLRRRQAAGLFLFFLSIPPLAGHGPVDPANRTETISGRTLRAMCAVGNVCARCTTCGLGQSHGAIAILRDGPGICGVPECYPPSTRGGCGHLIKVGFLEMGASASSGLPNLTPLAC